MYNKYSNKEIKSWAKTYIYNDFTVISLEEFLDIPHSTIWWSFKNKLKDIDYNLYKLTMKRLKINKSIGGRRKLDGKTVITSKQSIELPSSLRYENREIKKNMIIWRFNTEVEAIRAAKLFINKGFEVVRRLV